MRRQTVLLLIPLALSLALGWGVWRHNREHAAALEDLKGLQEACTNMLLGTDALSEHIRRFVLSNGSADARNAYFKEVKNDCHREKAIGCVVKMTRFAPSVRRLHEAMDLSLSLMCKEYHAMRLMTPDDRVALTQPEVREFRLADEELCVTYAERCRRAREEILGEDYAAYKADIHRRVSEALALARREVGR